MFHYIFSLTLLKESHSDFSLQELGNTVVYQDKTYAKVKF